MPQEPADPHQSPVEVFEGKAFFPMAVCQNGCIWLWWTFGVTDFCVLLQLSGQLVHLQSQLCLEAVKEGTLSQSSPGEVSSQTGELFLRPCTHQPRQQWHFEQLVAPKGS